MKPLILTILLASPSAFAHTTIVANSDLIPRTDNPGLKEAPCGNAKRISNPIHHKPGSTIRIDWKETKQHPGRFEIYFSQARDQDFKLLKTVDDNQNGDTDLPHKFSTTFALPDVRCGDCTVQLVQVMTEHPDRPKNYYSCADVILD